MEGFKRREDHEEDTSSYLKRVIKGNMEGFK
jgi:hypothetical protein